MQPLLMSPELGRNILIVIDNCPECLVMIRTAISLMTDIPCRFFTLLHCRPTSYWEHRAGPDLELQHELTIMQEMEDREIKLTELSFDQARALLQNAGVRPFQIRTKLNIEEANGATVSELIRGRYSGVILRSQDAALVRALQGFVHTKRFSNAPPIAMWAIDTQSLTPVAQV